MRLDPRHRVTSRAAQPDPPAADLLALFAAHHLDGLIDAAFRLLQHSVACDFASAFYTNTGEGFLNERDSRGRTYNGAFMRRYIELTPAIAIAAANPGIKLIPTKAGLPFTDTQLEQTAFFREIMAPQGWRHAVALCFWGEPAGASPVFVTSVFRQRGQADFGDADLEALAYLYPFIDCALQRVRDRAEIKSLRDGIRVVDARLDRLTGAERAVAIAAAGGRSNKDIADRLGKSVAAVKFLLHRVYQKTGVANRAALVAVLRSAPHEGRHATIVE